MTGVTSFWKSVNFRLNQAIGFVLQRFSEELPGTGAEGQLAYMDGSVYYHDGVQWRALGEGGGTANTVVLDFTTSTSDTWVVNHNYGRFVNVQTLDADGHEIFGTVKWDVETLNTVTVEFSEPTQGYVILGYGLGASQVAWNFTDQEVWVIPHNLGRLVTVQTLDSDGHEIIGTVEWDLAGKGTVTVTFTEPMTGTAIIL